MDFYEGLVCIHLERAITVKKKKKNLSLNLGGNTRKKKIFFIHSQSLIYCTLCLICTSK